MHRRVPALFADLYAAFERDTPPEAAPDDEQEVAGYAETMEQIFQS
jgi:hypothetical protein